MGTLRRLSRSQNHSSKRRKRQVEGRVSRLPSHLRSGYASRLRSSARTACDGSLKIAEPIAKSPSPSPVRPRPSGLTDGERRSSTTSLPGFSVAGATVLNNRWSYDRERMPISPPGSPSSRPTTPLSQASGFTSSRPTSTTSTLVASYPPSRPQTPVLSYRASTPALTVSPPPVGIATWSNPLEDVVPPDYKSEQPHKFGRHRYHLLSGKEMELLSKPPGTPTLVPRTAPPRPPLPRRSASAPRLSSSSTSGSASEPAPPALASGASTPESKPNKTPLTSELLPLDPPRQKREEQRLLERRSRSSPAIITDEDDGEKDKPSCLGLCEVATAQRMGGKFGAWLMGTLIPIASGFVTAWVAAAGCR
ncbi:hypothetical protein VTK56DRAFT_10027 [Thermocarpiscus australiensis]